MSEREVVEDKLMQGLNKLRAELDALVDDDVKFITDGFVPESWGRERMSIVNMDSDDLYAVKSHFVALTRASTKGDELIIESTGHAVGDYINDINVQLGKIEYQRKAPRLRGRISELERLQGEEERRRAAIEKALSFK